MQAGPLYTVHIGESENVLYIEGHGISRYDVQCTIDCLDEHGRYLGEGNDARYITVSRYTVCICISK